MLKELIRRAREVAEKHLPEDVRARGRQLADGVLERVPERVRATVEPYLAEERPDASTEHGDRANTPNEAGASEPEPAPASGGGWAPAAGNVRGDEYRVVVFGAPNDPASQRACALLQEEEIEHRIVDLRLEPRTANQLASVTGNMQYPYIYIDGRHWGSDGDLESLRALGDLAKIMARKLDTISDEGRRVGGLHETFDDSITIENVTERLHKGHILTVDGLDCWLENERVFHEGVPRPMSELAEVVREIVARADEDPDLDTQWRFEPAVDLNH
ncbi:MAG: glutaredoxin [Myxococcales bacterium]|nr:glutaredoxin [Myxococcales bacterium]MCB9752294.1 glutaredoxin [Myxococcales bacterium]